MSANLSKGIMKKWHYGANLIRCVTHMQHKSSSIHTILNTLNAIVYTNKRQLYNKDMKHICTMLSMESLRPQIYEFKE